MAGAEMTGSATEQSDVAMDSSLAVPAGRARQIDSTGSVHTMNLGTLPSVSQLQWEIHVDFNNGMWWAMPHDLSDRILDQWINGAQQVSFVWDWEETRRGSYRPDGADFPQPIHYRFRDYAPAQLRQRPHSNCKSCMRPSLNR